eukprot:1598405-Amphidinium_carterae.2
MAAGAVFAPGLCVVIVTSTLIVSKHPLLLKSRPAHSSNESGGDAFLRSVKHMIATSTWHGNGWTCFPTLPGRCIIYQMSQPLFRRGAAADT